MSAIETMEAAEFFSFNLGEEEFALAIGTVKEVLDCTTIFKLPLTPQYLLGMINLRGEVVPVVDLRIKLGMPAAETSETCIVIVELDRGNEHLPIGLLVDAVREVFALAPDQIKPAPKLGLQLDTEFISGIGKRGDGFLFLLELGRLFSEPEFRAIAHTRDQADPDDPENAGRCP